MWTCQPSHLKRLGYIERYVFVNVHLQRSTLPSRAMPSYHQRIHHIFGWSPSRCKGFQHLLVNNILSSFIRMPSPLIELENHQRRLDVGDVGFVQAIFRGTSPAQLRQRTISEQYCRDHLNDITAISGVDHIDKHNLLHLFMDTNIRPKTVSFVRERRAQFEYLVLGTSSSPSPSSPQACPSQQSPCDMDIDDDTYTTVICHSADVHINICYGKRYH